LLKKKQEERYQHIVQLFEKYKADVICLQEVIGKFIDVLVKNDYVRENYYIIHDDCKTWPGYGTYFLSTFPFILERYELITSMGRDLIVGVLNINNEKIYCGNIHLESLANPFIRSQQLFRCNELLDENNTALLLGDFNFASDKNYSLIERRRDLIEKGEDPYSISHLEDEKLENNVLKEMMPNFDDIWELLHPGENGYTFDSSINKMLKHYEEMRYDRILLKSNSWNAKSIQMIGNEPIESDEDGPLFPSDHFGLLMELKFK